jgi:hypothetical protein
MGFFVTSLIFPGVTVFSFHSLPERTAILNPLSVPKPGPVALSDDENL